MKKYINITYILITLLYLVDADIIWVMNNYDNVRNEYRRIS